MQTDGKLVEVLLCGAAGDLALKNAPLPQTEAITPQGVSVKDLAQKLLKQGGKISVCAIYLPKRKLTDDALIEGVTVAKPKEMAAKVSDPNIRVFGN